MLMFVKEALNREVRLQVRQFEDWINPLLFFVIVTSLFPLAFNADNHLLHQIGPGLIWVTALLATMLALDKLFRDDYEDGCLELMILGSQPMPLIAGIKLFVHWLLTGLPIIVAAPLLGLLLHLGWNEIEILMLSLLLGTPILLLVGAIIASLTLALKANGLLLSLLLLPLYIPVLIFGAGAVTDAGMGMPVSSQLAILAAMLVLAISVGPFAISSSLRVGYE